MDKKKDEKLLGVMPADDGYDTDGGKYASLFTAPEASVLVVDDITVNLMVAEGLMTSHEMNIDLCESGAEAIEAVKQKEHGYDLILMDHMMPEMDGIETVANIRALAGGWYKNVPIVALTANTGAGMRELFFANGFNDFLPKPIDISELDQILVKWIPKEKQKQPADTAGIPDISGISVPEEVKSEVKSIAGAEIKIAGVDIRKGISMAGGNPASYLGTLAVFYKDATDKIPKLETCLEKGDITLYTIYVHGLKSAAANIGAAGISKAAAELEEAGQRNDAGFINSHGARFLSDLNALLNNISDVLAEQGNHGTHDTGTVIDAGLLKFELLKMKEGLDDFDFRAVESASKNLQGFTHLAEIGKDVSEILQRKLIGAHEEAIERIDALVLKI